METILIILSIILIIILVSTLYMGTLPVNKKESYAGPPEPPPGVFVRRADWKSETAEQTQLRKKQEESAPGYLGRYMGNALYDKNINPNGHI